MAARDIAASKKRLKAAADNAQTDAEKSEIERLDMIQDHLEQFWDGIRNAVAAMQPAEEIVLSEVDRVAVIESSRTELAVQTYGRPRRYPIEALPVDLLSAIAKQSFKLTPGTKLVIGSFLAVDAHGNLAEARKLCARQLRPARRTESFSCRRAKFPQDRTVDDREFEVMTTPKTAHASLIQALRNGPPPPGNLAVPIFSHGSLVVELYTPSGHDPQKPHTRDEVYFVTRGDGFFFDGQQRHSVERRFIPVCCRRSDSSI